MISLCFMPAWHSLSPSECLLASAIPEVALWVPCVIKPLLSAGSIWASHRTSRTQWTGQGHVATRVAMAHPAGMSVLMGTRARQGEHSAPGFLPLTELHTGWNKTYGLVPAGHWCGISHPITRPPSPKVNYFTLQIQNLLPRAHQHNSVHFLLC